MLLKTNKQKVSWKWLTCMAYVDSKYKGCGWGKAGLPPSRYLCSRVPSARPLASCPQRNVPTAESKDRNKDLMEGDQHPLGGVDGFVQKLEEKQNSLLGRCWEWQRPLKRRRMGSIS